MLDGENVGIGNGEAREKMDIHALHVKYLVRINFKELHI